MRACTPAQSNLFLGITKLNFLFCLVGRGSALPNQTLFDLDHQYCVAVEGASQESNLWVPRNQVCLHARAIKLTFQNY